MAFTVSDAAKVQAHIDSALSIIGDPPNRELSLVKIKLEEADLWLFRMQVNNQEWGLR